jgi:hypothetical protein
LHEFDPVGVFGSDSAEQRGVRPQIKLLVVAEQRGAEDRMSLTPHPPENVSDSFSSEKSAGKTAGRSREKRRQTKGAEWEIGVLMIAGSGFRYDRGMEWSVCLFTRPFFRLPCDHI